MDRDVLKGVGMSKTDKRRTAYTPPEEPVVDARLIDTLVEYYIFRTNGKFPNLCNEMDFHNTVMDLEPEIGDSKGRFHPQTLIDSLTVMLINETDKQHFTRTDYLTAVVEALYNLDYGNEFTIDIRSWPKDDYYYAGSYFQGKPDNPLTLNLYGKFWACGVGVRYCNLILHNRVVEVGDSAKHSTFTLHDNVDLCGLHAEDCTFSLMPSARLKSYDAESHFHNTLRRMNENGEWEIIQWRG